jgi:conserved oligomeric Golgi complex subunit 3
MSDNKVISNLTQWDELSPLTEEQLKSISLLFQTEQQQIDDTDDNNEDNEYQDNMDEQVDAQKPKQINEEINELLYNFDINDIEDARVDKYVKILQDNSSKCKDINSSIGDALNYLNLLLENYSAVSEKTKSLHIACEQLISDQTKLVNASYLLNSRLSYFTDLELYLSKLNSPIIENNCEYVIPMLSRLDEILDYLEANKTHKENDTYNTLAHSVLRKALQIIKNYTINSLHAASTSIFESIAKETNSTSPSSSVAIKFSAENSYTMFYSKFRVNSIRIKTLMEQLEQRVELNKQSEYEEALLDCHRYYVEQRRLFIYSSVVSAVNEMVIKNQRDTCTLIRSSCSFMIHLCQDEDQLYKNFFSKQSVTFEFVFLVCF